MNMPAAKRILVIDDDAAACGLIEEVLSRHGIEVLTASEPREGLETARAFIPDLIFINLLLSDTNGLKMSKAIHAVKSLEKVPVIMLISHQGELDPKYTVTIGIIDTLVKPLKEAEIMEKTKAVLGAGAVTELKDEMLREIAIEEELEPMVLPAEAAMAEETGLASAEDVVFDPMEIEDTELSENDLMREMTNEGELQMPEKENAFNKKQYDDRNLFADESDIFGEELKKSRNEAEEKYLQEGEAGDGFSEDEVDLSYKEEKFANPVRRILLIAASIVAGIGLGVGGYLFFTAGNKQVPEGKQAVTVLPDPVAIPAPPAVPLEKSNPIPEIPVKTEPTKTVTAQEKETKAQEFVPISEAKKETIPSAIAKSEDKKVIKETGAYFVQVGLFAKEANARAMEEKLKKLGYAPSVKKIANKDNKVMFRVAAGTYGNFEKAVETSKVLNKQGIQSIVHKQ